VKRIVAICSTVVTRRTDSIISTATRYGLLLRGTSVLSLAIDHCSTVGTTVVEPEIVLSRYVVVDFVCVLHELPASSVSTSLCNDSLRE
jgi:hypothetical protein